MIYVDKKNYQWPQCFSKSVFFSKKKKFESPYKNILVIEKFFEKEFGQPTILFPSARSCIGAILEFEKINRSHEVYVNKWVSNCIFNAIGYFSNPTVNYKNQKIVLTNNSSGLVQRLKIKKNFKGVIIDDSCDSIILNKKRLFPNNSKYEIFSLPKLLGSVSGGIVISKSKKFYKFCKNRQKKNKNLGLSQSYLKFSEINKKADYDYRYNEVINSYFEYNGVLDIKKKLNFYYKNKNIIIKRLNIIKKYFSYKIDENRVGPVILFDLKKNKHLQKLKKIFMFRHRLINYKKNLAKNFLIFPLHYKISEKKFYFYLKKIISHKKNLKIFP
jgi:putative PLP-dependent aminotransferase (TIGR04422 family)